ncbi:MAG: ATP-binding protein [Parcubacteria group bacterium]|nr:ATP-binding protein [Parcubacteria group bacterium]
MNDRPFAYKKEAQDEELPYGKKNFDNLTQGEKEEILKAEEIYKMGLVSIRDIIAPSAMKVDPNYLRLNEKFVRTLFVFTYPRYLTVGWFSSIVNLNEELDISFYINPVSSEKILKTLKSKVGQIRSTISAQQEKGAVRDPMLETALGDVEELRDRLVQGTERFFHLALYITIYAETKKELEEKTKEIEGLLGHKLVYSKRTIFQMEEGFNSTMPLGNDEIGVVNSMNTSPISTTFPFVSSELSSDEGILYGINRHNNSLIIFDRFTLPNANSVVFAIPGAGKSYAIKLEILRSLMFGADVIVVDPENEYKHLCDAVGGTFLRISLDSDYRLNPFDLPPNVTGMSAEDIIRSAVINLKGLMRLMLGRMTKEEDALVDKALIETYAKKDITSQSDLNKIISPTMQDFQDILETMEGAEDLVTRIKKYTEGTFSGLFNQPTNVEMNANFVVFSIRDIEEELRPIAMYVVLNYIWNIVRAQLKRRMLVIDEAWWMMQYEDSARFMYSMAKRGRKYYLGMTTISQDVSDFLNSDHGKAVVTNSSMMILLKQSPANIDLLKKTFYLTDEEKYLLLESDVGEGIFFAGPKHVAIKIVASYMEDQLITTDPKQILEIEKSKEELEERVAEEQNQDERKIAT